jgi:hypothetical protein
MVNDYDNFISYEDDNKSRDLNKGNHNKLFRINVTIPIPTKSCQSIGII